MSSRYGFPGVLILTVVLSGSVPGAQAQRFTTWSSPVNVVEVNQAGVDGCPFIAKDGVSLYFASNRTGGAGMLDLYVAERPDAESAFGVPTGLYSANSPANDLCPTISIDGHRLFFVSARAGGCGGNDIYMSFRRDKRDNLGWEVPEHLGCTLNTSADEFSPAYFEDDDGTESLYFSSCAPICNIYVSTRHPGGAWTAPTAVTELNSAAADMRPNITRDGLAIYFDSTRGGGFGSSDLYVATRATTVGPWSAPQNLGPVVNSTAADFRPAISFDGTTLYFSSTRTGSVNGSVDVWVTTRAKVTGRPE